jgi:hypothetical protein
MRPGAPGHILFAMREGPDARLYDVYSSRGELRVSFHAMHPLIRSVPGWIAAARSHGATQSSSFRLQRLDWSNLNVHRAQDRVAHQGCGWKLT